MAVEPGSLRIRTSNHLGEKIYEKIFGPGTYEADRAMANFVLNFFYPLEENINQDRELYFALRRHCEEPERVFVELSYNKTGELEDWKLLQYNVRYNPDYGGSGIVANPLVEEDKKVGKYKGVEQKRPDKRGRRNKS